MALDPVHQPSGLRLSLIMVGLCLAVFLTGMDQTILATATPIISNEFRALDDIGWWSNAYLLTLSSFQLFYGKLYSLFSVKLVYLTAIALFELGSLICATAPNSIALIIGRAIAGLGAAGVFSGSILITTKLIPLSRRAAYLGIMSGAFGLAAIVGPFLGGALTDRSTWRWCFGINLPLGVVTVIICAMFVHTPKQPDIRSIGLVDKFKRLDIPGTTCMVGSLLCLLIALQWGGSAYPWNSSRIIALFVVFGVLLILFLATQMTSITGNSRTLPASLLRNRDIWLAAGYAMCITGGIYVAILYLPVWFQAIRGSSALVSGAMLAPLIGGYVVCSIVSGGITSAVGYYNPGLIVGTVLSIAGAALLTTINTESPISKIIGYQLLYGFGVGFGFGQPSYVVQTLLPPSDVPVGVTFITLMQNVSASIFVAVAQSILQGELRSRLQSKLSAADIDLLLDSGAGDFASFLPPDSRQEAISVYSVCLILTLYICLALSCVSVISAVSIRWRSMKGENVQTTVDVTEQLPEAQHRAAVENEEGTQNATSKEMTSKA